MGYDEENITTPAEGEELPPVVVEDVTDSEPVKDGRSYERKSYHRDTARECTAKKADGTQCHGIAKTGTMFCMHHQQIVELKEEPLVPEKPQGMQPYPFHDGTINENAAIRAIAMVIPCCPIDPVPEVKQRDGSYRPNPNFTGEQNCQQVYKFNNMGRWDAKKCESLGHDPWHTTFRRAILEEIVDAEGYVVDTKTKYKVEHRLNVIRVSDNMRHSSGMEIQLALARGCRPLEDFGYLSPCEFRNCSQPQRVDTRYGKYCSERHARLVAADKTQKILPVPSDPYSAEQATREREDMLENLNIRKGA